MRRVLLTITILLVAACGGGGGTSPASNLLSVTPALGGVSAGVNVTVFDAQTGAQLGTATTTVVNGLGTASISIPATFTGIAVIKVSGCSSCTYLDERTFQPVTFGTSDSLLAVMPSNSSGQDRSIGVSTLTNMAAAKLGVTSNSFNGTTFTPPTIQITTTNLNAAVSTVLDIFGVSGTDSANVDLFFSKPVVFGINSTAGDKLLGSGGSLNLGVLLTALANSVPPGTALTTQSASLSQVLYQSFQDPTVNVKSSIASGNLISDFSNKLTAVKQNNIDANSSLDSNFSSKLEQASQTISSSSSSSSSSGGGASTPSTATVSATASNSTVAIGLSTQIHITYKAADGTSTAVSSASATYTTSNSKVLTVTKTGLVNAMGPGKASIVVTYQNTQKSVEITVPNGSYPNGFSGQVYN